MPAARGIETIVFCPDDTPEINVREIALQGARVYRVNGLIDDCGAIVGKGAREGRWFDFSTLKEPYRIEGKKTMGLELAAQLGWRAARRDLLPDRRRHRPDRHVEGVRRAGGARLDRRRSGRGCSRSRPKAARRSSARSRRARSMRRAGRMRTPSPPASACRRAVGDFLILRAVRESGGFALAVPDPAILAAVDDGAAKDGLLLCPEGGATLAA